MMVGWQRMPHHVVVVARCHHVSPWGKALSPGGWRSVAGSGSQLTSVACRKLAVFSDVSGAPHERRGLAVSTESRGGNARAEVCKLAYTPEMLVTAGV